MFLGVIVATLSVIVAGYIHGNMHLLTTLKNAANPLIFSLLHCYGFKFHNGLMTGHTVL